MVTYRLRDIDPSIRSSCVESLASWVAEYPSLVLDSLYLKYLGMALNDKVTPSRAWNSRRVFNNKMISSRAALLGHGAQG